MDADCCSEREWPLDWEWQLVREEWPRADVGEMLTGLNARRRNGRV